MLQHAAHSLRTQRQGPLRTPGAESGGLPAAELAPAGNAAAAAELGEGQEHGLDSGLDSGLESGADTGLAAPWSGFGSAAFGRGAAGGFEMPKKRGSSPDEVGAAARPATAPRGGASGALIGQGEEVTLYSGSSARAKVVTKVPDGSACEVKESRGERLRVKVRQGDKNVEGWVDRAVFSTQPTLSQDEDDKALRDDFAYSYFGGDQSPKDPKVADLAQGALGDCFFIASMAAVVGASPGAIQDAVKYDPRSKKYTVRFYEEQGRGRFKPVFIEVDAYLPTVEGDRRDPAYAADPGSPLWPAILEKAYAQWKGGYDVLGEGGTGDEAMSALTGSQSRTKNPASMKEADVIPYFKAASADGLAIYAGVRNTGEMDVQTPLSGTASGPYRGRLAQTHKWNEVEPGTLTVTDKGKKVAGARDKGEEGDATGAVMGADVKAGSIDYKGSQLELEYKSGKAPTSAADLEVRYQYHGMLDPQKVLIGNHAYAFQGVVEQDKLQFFNPWGSYQPKPITASEFLRYFDSLATNQVPKQKVGGG
jgi:hypothetical protein